MFKTVKNKKAGFCPAYRCPNKAGNKKKFCPRHHAKAQKEKNPESYYYNLLKQNAKRRKKFFSLTLVDFKKFCKETDYMKLKGKSATSASIDRIDHLKGYEVGNLQILTLSENSKKMHEDNKNESPF